jgi:hypothetical protein
MKFIHPASFPPGHGVIIGASAKLPSLTLFQAASYLPKMSIDPNHCFFACAKAGFERRPVFSPATPVVAAADDRCFITDPFEQ